ncbi:protein transport protein gos1 [Tieghemiomyces parasiticus]|uniref:Protein transport protein gos1 n=1 Tax=Tieghemiomyces parasiticus TaxID=78921 RepID=A0A9W7ZI99_9FUNG|nr:protein transport protein gos1 [Tieghemiomyces parasiticus]
MAHSQAGNRGDAPSWENLRREVRQLQSSLDQSLTRFHQLTSSSGGAAATTSARAHRYPPATSSAVGSSGKRLTGDPSSGAFDTDGISVTATAGPQAVRRAETELDDLLDRLRDVVDAMARVQESRESTGSQVAMRHTLQRNRDVLFDYNKEVQRAKDKARDYRQRSDLLDGHGSLDDMIDMTLTQAYAVRGDLDEQRSILTRGTYALRGLTQRIPGINLLLNKIGYRRRRDQLILCGLIALLLFFLLWYKMG